MGFGTLVGTVDASGKLIAWANGTRFTRPPTNPANVAGAWYNISTTFEAINIVQSGRNLTIKYPTATYPGLFIADNEFSGFGQSAIVSADLQTIAWRLGAKYVRGADPAAVPNLAGRWRSVNDNASVQITQTGVRLVFQYASGAVYNGLFTDTTHLAGFDALTGTINAAGTAITWSNGAQFTKAP